MKVIDLFCGVGGFSCGAKLAGARNLFSVEWEPRIAAVYRLNHSSHDLFVEELGAEPAAAMATRILAAWGGRGRLHVHGSPPCQKLSQINRTNPDTAEGMRLVKWYLDVVSLVQRPGVTWSMEQVPHAALGAYLTSRGVPFHVVTASDHGVPQSRKRLIAASERIVQHLNRMEGSGPTVVPLDVLDLTEDHLLCSGTANNTVRKDGKTVGYRPMRPGEGGRPLTVPCHTVYRKPGRVYDKKRGVVVRSLTEAEMGLLQGFPKDYIFDARSKTRSRVMIGNALPPPLACSVVRAARRGGP